MSTSPAMQKSVFLLPIPPLTSSTKDGKPYVRSAAVIAEIQMTSELDPDQWRRAAPDLKRETIVYMIRRSRRTHQTVAGLLLLHLKRRAIGTARWWIHGVYEAATEFIVSSVDMEITELVLTDKVSRQTEALEFAFGQAVARRTTHAVEKFRNSPLGHAQQIIGATENEDGETLEDPVESIPDQRPGPHENLVETENDAHCRQLIEIASGFVTDPRHLRAVRLRYLKGWAISRIAAHFKKTARQIQNWINTALKQMKEGVNGHDGAQSLVG